MEVRFARDHVDYASPEAPLRFYFAFQAETAFKRQFAAAVK